MKQAIYGWRGGDARLFDTVQASIADIATQSLSTSFRSCKVIIDTVNQIFTNALQHPSLGGHRQAVADWCAMFQPHSTGIASSGYASLQVIEGETESKEERQDLAFQQAADLAARLAAERPDLSIGVLVRKNEAVGRLVALLRQRNTHASEEGGNPLTDSAAVLAILAAMQLADHPGDRVARFHVASTPLAEAFDVRGPALHERAADKEARRIARLLRSRLLHDGYGPTVFWLAGYLLPHCSPRESSRLRQLIELAYGYQHQANLRPSRFVRFIEKERQDDPSSAKVRVMTVHQSKGLQFDTVILPQLEVDLAGQTPTCVASRMSPDKPVDLVFRYVKKDLLPFAPHIVREAVEQTAHRAITEAMCLLYVAVTLRQARFVHVRPIRRRQPSRLRRVAQGVLGGRRRRGGR